MVILFFSAVFAQTLTVAPHVPKIAITFSAIFSEVEKKFDTMCFNLRSLADEKKAKMGINECVNHGLITPFPVLVSIVSIRV